VAFASLYPPNVATNEAIHNRSTPIPMLQETTISENIPSLN
jgi:hypothetical protein